MKQLSIVTLAILAFQLTGCGGSSSSPALDTEDTAADTTAPTVSSITVSGGNATPSAPTLSTAQSVSGVSIQTNAFTITFSEAMDSDTVSDSTVTLNCNDSAVAATVSSTDSSTYVLAPAAALSQLASCTLTVGTGVEDAAGNALAEAAIYSFGAGCNTNDDFGTAATLTDCWEADNTPTANISTGQLTFTQAAVTTATPPMEFKSFGDEDLTVTVKVPAFSGLTGGGTTTFDTDGCALQIIDGTDNTIGATVKVEHDEGDDIGLAIMSSTIGGASPTTGGPDNAGSASTDLAGALYLRLTQIGTSITASFRIGDTGDFTPVGPALSSTFGATKGVALAITSNGTGEVSCSFDDFTVSGGSATGQD